MDNSRIIRDQLRDVVQEIMLKITDPYDALCGAMFSVDPREMVARLTDLAADKTADIEHAKIVFVYNEVRDVINYELIINNQVWETSTFYIY